MNHSNISKTSLLALYLLLAGGNSAFMGCNWIWSTWTANNKRHNSICASLLPNQAPPAPLPQVPAALPHAKWKILGNINTERLGKSTSQPDVVKGVLVCQAINNGCCLPRAWLHSCTTRASSDQIRKYWPQILFHISPRIFQKLIFLPYLCGAGR